MGADTLPSTTTTTTATMKAFIALCLVAAVSGRPEGPTPAPIKILSYSYQPYGAEPAYSYSFKSENEIEQSEEGQLRSVIDPETNKPSEVMVMRGSYSYVGPDSLTYQVEWYADETSFHASAPHLPQPVAPNHPEVAAAVEAQLRFAAEQGSAAPLSVEQAS